MIRKTLISYTILFTVAVIESLVVIVILLLN